MIKGIHYIITALLVVIIMLLGALIRFQNDKVLELERKITRIPDDELQFFIDQLNLKIVEFLSDYKKIKFEYKKLQDDISIMHGYYFPRTSGKCTINEMLQDFSELIDGGSYNERINQY